MLCQNCGENEANVKYTQIVNGVKKQMNLCSKCAKELGIEDINFNMPISFSSFLGDMFDMYESPIPSLLKPEVLTCNKCNMTYDEFLKTGKIGCDNCYEVFEPKLDLLLKNIHGVNRHVGRIGKFVKEGTVQNEHIKENKKQENNSKEQKNKKKTKLEILQERLKQEIKEERYEDAAKTRDEIKKIGQNRKIKPKYRANPISDKKIKKLDVRSWMLEI